MDSNSERGKDPRIALVAGSFDPITMGHMDLVYRAAERFSKVYLTVFINDRKRYLFDLATRRSFLELAVKDLPGVTADSHVGLLVEYAAEKGITAVVKGYRNAEDLHYEQQQAAFNREHFPDLETVLLPSDGTYRNLSSTEVRRRLLAGESIGGLVPVSCEKAIADAYKRLVKK